MSCAPPEPNDRPTCSEPEGWLTESASASPDLTFWELRLYVAGQTPRSVAALRNLKQLCETHLAGQFRIEVIDLLVHPQLAKGDQIFAIPTLVRRLPEPLRRFIGDFSNTERVLVGLDLRPHAR